jgi:hypothetical protein
MRHSLKKLGLTFAGGCLGGVTATALNIAFGLISFPSSVGIAYHQDANIANLYAGILLGGVWGFIFLIPILNNSWILKGVILSLIPTLTQLLVVLPLKEGSPLFNVDFTKLTPIYVLFLNLIWGLVTAGFLEYTKGDETFD